MKKIIIASLLVLSTSAFGANWAELDSDHESTSYIDLDSVQKSKYKGNTIVGAWDKFEFYNGKMVGGKYAHSSAGFGWFNCKDKTMSNIVEWIAYDKRGNKLKSEKQSIKKFEPVYPNSYGEKLLDVACTQALIQEFVALGGPNMTERQFNQLSAEYPEQMDNFMSYLEYLSEQ